MAHFRFLPAAAVLASLAFASHSAHAANLPMLLNLSAAISSSMTAASQNRITIRPILRSKNGSSAVDKSSGSPASASSNSDRGTGSDNPSMGPETPQLLGKITT